MKTLSRFVGIALGLAALPALAETYTCQSTAFDTAGPTDAGVANFEIYYLNPAGGLYKTSPAYAPGSTPTPVYLNGTATSEPSAVENAAYVRGTNRALWEVTNTGVWTSLGGDITWNPSAVDIPGSGNSTRMVFYRGTNKETWYVERVNGVWGPHTSLGGVATSSPQAVSWGNGHVAVFNRGQDGGIWYRERNGGVWTAWASLGLNSDVDPAVVTHGTGTYTVFTRAGSTVHMNRFSGGTWTGWTNLYAPPPGAISEPAAVALASGYAVFVMAEKELVNTSYFRRIYKKISLDGGATWSNWEPIMYQYDTAVSNPEAWGPSNGYNYTVAAPTTNNGHGLLNFCWGQVP